MNKKVIYTCITGDYDELKNHSFVNKDWDYICFTDNKELLNNKNLLWQIRPIEFKDLDDVRNQRWHKLHPHVLFPQYDRSLWVDANMDILSIDIFNEIDKVTEEKSFMSIPKHSVRDCIYDEALACINLGKDSKDIINKQVYELKNKKFPIKQGLFETGIIYREHNNKDIIKIMSDWWWWIENYSRRDQLSLNYVLWVNNFKVAPLNRKGVDFVYGINHITKEELILQKDNLQNILNKNQEELTEKELNITQKDQEINALKNSTSWKITMPIRFIKDNFLKIGGLLKKSIVVLKKEGMIILFKKSFRYLLNKFYFLFNKIILKTKNILPESIKSILRPYFNKLISIKHENLESIFKIDQIELEKQKIVKFEYSPKISIIVPTYNTPKKLLEEMIESVIDQTYSNWELCIADGSNKEETINILKRYSEKDNHIKVIFLDKNEGISSNSNKAIGISTGEYIAFLDHDDTLAPFALYEVVLEINKNKKTDIIYSDEDKITLNGKEHFCPFFKPDWSPEFLRGVMYVGHFLVVKKELAVEVGLLDSNFDKIQDYEFMLRLSEKTNNISHISKILYHWRSIPGSIASNTQAKGDINSLQEKAVNAHLKRIGLNSFAKNNGIPHRLYIYPMKEKEYPLVSIIIPTKNNGDVIDLCLKSLINKTNYPNYEIIIIDNNTTEKKAINVIEKYSNKIIKYNSEFNFSEVNNIGAKNAKGDYLIFLNNDTEIIDSDWIINMLYYAEQKDVGAVGPMLIYPNNTIQHAGVVLGFRGTADHIMRDFPIDSDGYFGSLRCAREVSVVTAACIMIKKSIFEEVGGFNQHYKIIYQDVDLCLRIRNKNYKIIYTPLSKLIHHESKSRGNNYNYLDRLLLLDLWEGLIKKGDPYYNVNFNLKKYSKNNTGYNL